MTEEPKTETRPRPEAQHFLAALVRQLGRARVTRRELDEIRAGKLDVRVIEGSGDVVLEYLAPESYRGGLR